MYFFFPILSRMSLTDRKLLFMRAQMLDAALVIEPQESNGYAGEIRLANQRTERCSEVGDGVKSKF